MKNTEEKIQNTFINFLHTKEIENITVLEICRKLKIQRQTFYYHYQSIYDLIISIFYTKRIEVKEKLNFEENIRLLEGFFENNRVLCKSICDSFAENILIEYINSFVFRLLELKLNNTKIKKRASTFYSKGIGDLILNDFKNDQFNARNLLIELQQIVGEFNIIIK